MGGSNPDMILADVICSLYISVLLHPVELSIFPFKLHQLTIIFISGELLSEVEKLVFGDIINN